MNTLLQDQFQRVENGLDVLLDSIYSYTPSALAVETLIEADDELSRRLDQLSTHQINLTKINQLRQTTAALSDQIIALLTSLSTTRAQLLATPATVFPEDGAGRVVAYDELLAYAKRISKFTVPPTFRAPHPAGPVSPSKASSPVDGDARGEIATASHQGGENGLANNQAMTMMMMANGTTTNEANDAQRKAKSSKSEGVAIAALPTQESEWLDPAATVAFTPWPTDNVMARGALGRIQVMLDTGEDPALVVSTDEPLPGDAKMAGDGREGGKREEEVLEGAMPPEHQPPPAAREMDVEDHRARPRPAEPPQPAVYGGLDLYNPDEE